MCQGKLTHWNNTHYLRVVFHATCAKNAHVLRVYSAKKYNILMVIFIEISIFAL